MKRYAFAVLATLGVVTLEAQVPSELINEAKQTYSGIKKNLVNMTAAMPEENYAFKATPDVRTFGQLVAHVADSLARTCSTVSGETKSINAGSKTSKADLVNAMNEAVSMCDAAFDSLTPENAGQMVKVGRGERTRLGALMGAVAHADEEYGYMAVYLRLKGVVPPSSAGR